MSGRVVVGVDGSENARMAVRWAATEAGLRQMRLDLVSAWDIPIYSYAFAGGVAGVQQGNLLEESKEHADRELATAKREARAEAAGVEIETIAAQGQPADVLLEAAKGADLLVVGSRGLGGFRGLLLGSVSQQCAHHARCPIVIVRAEA